MPTLFLSQTPAARYAMGALMYFAQGIPAGLLGIALPAWLASEGASAGEVGSYLAIISLPWAFKLVTGPLMDRFEYLPMGRRRPWVIAAQLGLALAFLALAQIDDASAQIGLLSMIGFFINCFAATQDVAVDGMAIDVTPLREQGRLNGFMSFGKAIGWSSTAAVSGITLTTWGLTATAMLGSLVSLVGLLVILAIRERSGEKVMPWTAGSAAQVSRDNPSFRVVMTAVNKVLWSRTSIMVMAIMFFDGLVSGYGSALMPFAAVNLFGYSTAQWSQLVAMMGLTGAILALLLGPVIDRIGAKGMLIITFALVGAHALALSQTQHLWENTTYVRTMLSLYIVIGPTAMVASLALAMAVCSSSVSATQFAIYMSTANLGGVFGAKLYGLVAEESTYVQEWSVLSGMIIFVIIFVMFYRHGAEQDTEQEVRKPNRKVTVGVAGAGAVSFQSGAIRCPKCRTDMEAVDQDGVEVDRCQQCKGLWFDDGELESIKGMAAVIGLDTGDTATGAQHDALRVYDCPRCGGTMTPATDPRQASISFETCQDCQGSFLDAGELTRSLRGEFTAT
jgi:PAT family beta-lactamase induction signal transducer AmpG